MDINPVLFGVLDVEVQQQQGVYDNVCFGKTMWLAESPSKDQLKCRECGEVCSLLVQIYCPFPGAPSSQHRKIFIAVCPTHHKCASGWKVIRQLRTEEPAQVIAQDAVFGDDGDDDWGVEENEDEAVSWAATQMQGLSIANQNSSAMEKEEKRESSSFKTIKEGLFIEVYEAESSEQNYAHENELYQKYMLEETMGGTNQAAMESNTTSDEMETDDEEDEDEVVQEFLEGLRQQPSQILRYQVMGKPLSLDPQQYSNGAAVPRCDTCGASRGFELQLMPRLGDILGANFSIGTVQIFTCSRNCSLEQNSFEHVVIQDEPDSAKFK
ncbi:Oidioi.mRNA.OKI2018_I69.PAR.g10372.t1.cds [Oikopleura dioica]|uniref:Oidioi.mRNA.OKI2018_I69.PAR.g10372.t1.cds n=1 Tax=Oikopleura dioica TaxID=34765 RepID=A0ABN7RQB5_OIKDI|nr:Oidioi.mRNA.OKI2018_I69.PAR.g10372.t1.cds [Oikopleura dioica]